MTTETVKTEVQPTPNEAYAVAEMRFMCASQIVIRSTGEVVEITPVMKLVYIYMKNQFIGFSRDKQQFYTDQRQMAAALGVSRDTFSKVLAALKKLGIVETAGWKGNSESYTVHFFNDVADNLQVIHKEWKGVPAWDHERANKNFKSKNQKPTNEENKGDDESDQGDAEQRDGVPDIHSDQHDDIPPDDDAVNQDEIAIFDENNVVTEAFINGADNPRIGRNDDGTVQNYRYTYARAKTAQAFQDGKASPQAISDSWSIWFNAARPEYIPVHLLPVHERPVLAGYFDDDEEF
ncbi:TPA: winged helix-turn-helix domain-containing protein [Klebsiella quasipneumoniae subsp. quasipneumoniae]|nr:helix-turn-helix domain-containing protein [Klebsiella pneumoniae]HCI5948130.1 winged helix-turn-helix domain-containing protein [Klebsiella quasipneumoniae subsp. quasipneumoniae]HCI6902383.1 winged helix-turn-helix domain-containing protein [Klebsiella quasipneumoniae subsp. quasipneumoniae]